MSNILKIIGREIIDSRGYPTVEAEVYLKKGVIGRASVPSGASKGSNEALELRDGDQTRFFGQGVTKAVNSINKSIAPLLLGKNAEDQKLIDNIMINLDGTTNKSNLGSNAILAVSLAIAKATSLYKGINLYEYIAELNGTPGHFSMPLPMINIINGGKHADNNIEIQEFMIQPVGAKTFKEAVRIGAEVFHNLGKIIKNKKLNTSVGDEGGYAPNINYNYEALDLIIEAVKISNYKLYKDITLAIDCAASEFFNKKTLKYQLKSEKKNLNSKEFIHYLENLIKKYPIISIEDGLYELAWKEFIYFTKLLGNKIQIVGDDLFVTNTIMLKKGIEKKVANSILIKLNQIGTLSETLLTIKMAKNAGYSTIISHRSGETEDTTIADLAVGTAAGQIKIGSMSRSERVAKYNQLIRIEEQLNNKFLFKGLQKLKFNKNINI